MRESFVPLFQDIRNSSLWAHDSDIRIVWFTLLTLADPEGFVPAAIPGIAVAANVPVDKAREAVAIFEAPDPDSRSEELEGRRLEKVPRGWRIVNFRAHADRARHEAEKARKRRWAQRQRDAAANDRGEGEFAREFAVEAAIIDAMAFADGVDATETPRVAEGSGASTTRVETVDASKSKSKSKSGEEKTPPPPVPVQGQPQVWFTLEGWTPSAEVRADAVMAGVRNFDQRLAELRTGPIGGRRGVTDRDAYVRAQLPKWRDWDATDAAQKAAPSGRRGAPEPEPAPKRPSVPGCPAWVHPDHAALATEKGLNLRYEARLFATNYHIPVRSLRPIDLFEPFLAHLVVRGDEERVA